jgi:hypothetical protein
MNIYTLKDAAAVERIWHIQDSPGHILALAFRQKSLILLKFSVFCFQKKWLGGVGPGRVSAISESSF